MRAFCRSLASKPEQGQDLAILTYRGEGPESVVRDRLIPNGTGPRPTEHQKKRHPTVVRGPVPRNAWPPCCCVNRFFSRAASLGPSGP